MKQLNDTQKQSIALVLLGTLIAVLAIHPPRWLVSIYLILERAVAACVGVLLAVAGAAALMGLAKIPSGGKPVYTFHFDEDGNPVDETEQ